MASHYETAKIMDLKVFNLNKDCSLSQNEFLFLIGDPFTVSSENKIVPIPYSFGFDSQCLSSRASIKKLYVKAARSTLQFKARDSVRGMAAVASDYLFENFELDHWRSPNLPRAVIVVAVYRSCGSHETEIRTAIRNAAPVRIAENQIGRMLKRLRGLSDDAAGGGGLISRVPPLYVFNRADCTGSCAICLQDFTAETDPRKMPCNHIFHRSCIARWVWVNTSCPLCRSPLISRQIC